MKYLIEYFLPHRRIARRLRQLQKIAGKHYFLQAYSEFGRMASEFEKFKP